MSFFKKILGKKNSGDDEGNDEIESKMKESLQPESRVISLLLLGEGGSGKSTVLKQLTKIYRPEQKTLQDAEDEIKLNILQDIFDICKHSIIYSQKDAKYKIKSKECQITSDQILKSNFLNSKTLTSQLCKDICILWKDAGFQATFIERSKSYIMDNLPYFIERLHKIGADNYIVSFDDYIRCRRRTSGIIYEDFEIPFEDVIWTFKITDVGGQRSERKKWIHVFADVSIVIYVMALSAYDQVVYEDNQTRCWDETLSLFESTTSLKPFKKTDFIVFLNKNDIFERKLAQIPFTVYYENFDDDNKHSSNAVKDFIKNEFNARFYQNKNPKDSTRLLHFHVTCSLDSNQIQTVMTLIQLDTIRKMMKKSALL